MTETEFRLKTDIWVASEIRRCEAMLLNAVISHKGDQGRGLVLIKQYVYDQGCQIYSQSRDFDDKLIWHQPLGEEWLQEDKVDQYISRQRDFDEDLWVIEIEDPKGQYTPEG